MSMGLDYFKSNNSYLISKKLLLKPLFWAICLGNIKFVPLFKSMSYPRIILNKGKEFSLLRRHPWVFSGAIAKKDNNLQDGDLVEVFSNKQEFLGIGYYAGGSIAVRLISFEPTVIDEEFWFKKISKAYGYRRQLGILNAQTNVCRLFFGEGDGVPG